MVEKSLERLGVLADVWGALAQAESVDDLCRIAVELGRERLGFDRIAIWFVDTDPSYLRGSFGIGAQGELLDERTLRRPIRPASKWHALLFGEQASEVEHDRPLRNVDGEVIGHGSFAAASLWDGRQSIGLVVTDNLRRQEPITESDVNFLELYASILGTLYSARQGEANFQALAMNAFDGIVVADAEGRHVYANPRAAELTGYSLEELLTIGMQGLAHPEETPALCARLEKRLRGESTPKHYESRIVRKDGTALAVEVGTTRTTWRGAPADLVFFRDISDRKRHEEELKKFKTIADHAGYGVAIVDLAGYLIYANESFAGMHGLSPENILGASLSVFHTPEQMGRVNKLLTTLKREGSFTAEEVWHKHQDGTVFPTLMNCSIIYGEEGEPAFMTATAVDITARKRTEQVIAAQQVKMIASSRLASIGTMAGGISHEVKNPLANISAAAEQLERLLSRASADTDMLENLTGIIMRNVDRIDEIIHGLQNLARDASGDSFAAVPLKAIIEDSIALSRTRFRLRGIRTQTPSVDDGLMIECRRALISQVLVNLLNNAYDAVADAPERWVELGVTDREDVVDLTVTDSGSGMPPDLAGRAFDPFFTTKGVGQGMGLGLSISRSIVEDHCGTLFIDPESPHTRFVIRLPKIHPGK